MPIDEQIREFLTYSSKMVAAKEQRSFDKVRLDALGGNLSAVSYGEQRFYIAFSLLAKLNELPELHEADYCQKKHQVGCGLMNQVEVKTEDAKFKVDFMAIYGVEPWMEPETKPMKALVYCGVWSKTEMSDSDRRRMNYRDEILYKLPGYKLFKFTAKELRENPLIPAAKVLHYVAGCEVEKSLSLVGEMERIK